MTPGSPPPAPAPPTPPTPPGGDLLRQVADRIGVVVVELENTRGQLLRLADHQTDRNHPE